eukprot:529209-Prymnesium_polylepis.1
MKRPRTPATCELRQDHPGRIAPARARVRSPCKCDCSSPSHAASLRPAVRPAVRLARPCDGLVAAVGRAAGQARLGSAGSLRVPPPHSPHIH